MSETRSRQRLRRRALRRGSWLTRTTGSHMSVITTTRRGRIVSRAFLASRARRYRCALVWIGLPTSSVRPLRPKPGRGLGRRHTRRQTSTCGGLVPLPGLLRNRQRLRRTSDDVEPSPSLRAENVDVVRGCGAVRCLVSFPITLLRGRGVIDAAQCVVRIDGTGRWPRLMANHEHRSGRNYQPRLRVGFSVCRWRQHRTHLDWEDHSERQRTVATAARGLHPASQNCSPRENGGLSRPANDAGCGKPTSVLVSTQPKASK